MTETPAAAVLLYVEDEYFTRDSVEHALREAGFQVIATTGGREALDILELGPETLLGVITDVDLGDGPDGWEVARRARELLPGIPIIYATGDNDHEWTSKGVPQSVLIAKPFAPAQIVVAIAAALNAAGRAD